MFFEFYLKKYETSVSIILNMKPQKFNRQEIIEYLLGSLSAAKTERFDELSLTDDEFADALASAENDLVDSYVQGELAGAALEKFNSHYPVSPLRREKVEFARNFQTFAERNISREIGTSSSKQSADGFWESLNVFKNKFSVAQWSLGAATLLLMILSGVWIIHSLSNRQNDEAATQIAPVNVNQENVKSANQKQQQNNSKTEPEIAAAAPENKTTQKDLDNDLSKRKTIAQAERTTAAAKKNPSLLKINIASFILAIPQRGGNIKSLSIPEKTTDIDMQLELEADDYSAYRAVLTDQSGNAAFWRSGKLKAAGKDDGKTLRFRFPAKLLKSKIYTIEVSGINADGEAEIISNYPFRPVIK